jgi:hypothetical protein
VPVGVTGWLSIIGSVVRSSVIPIRRVVGVRWIHRSVGPIRRRRVVVAICRRIISIGRPVAAVGTSSPANVLDGSNLSLRGYSRHQLRGCFAGSRPMPIRPASMAMIIKRARIAQPHQTT